MRIGLKLILLGAFAVASSATVLAQDQSDPLTAARKLLQQGKNAEAIGRLKGLAAKRPALQGVAHELGVAYYREGEYLEASKYLQAAWDEDENDRDAAQLLGLSYYFSGRLIEAIPPLEKVRLWRPDANIDALYILGICYAAASRYGEARGMFAQLYAVSPDSAAAHLLLARMLVRQGFDAAAEREASAALLISPHLPLAHLTLGELSIYGGNYPKAVEELKAEVALNPAYALSLTHLGDVYWRLDRDEDSQKALQSAISLDAATAEPYVVLGKVLFREGHVALAERNLRQAVKLDPGNYTAHYVLGELYRDQGKLDSAQRELAAATRIQRAQAARPARN